MNPFTQKRKDAENRPDIVHKTTIHHQGHAVSLHLPLKGRGMQLDSRESLILAKLAILDAPFQRRTEQQEEAMGEFKAQQERAERKKRRVLQLIKKSTEDSPRFTKSLKRIMLRLLKTESFNEQPPAMLKDSGGWVGLAKLRYQAPEFSDLEFQNCVARLKSSGLLQEFIQSDGKRSWPEVKLSIRADVSRLAKLEDLDSDASSKAA